MARPLTEDFVKLLPQDVLEKVEALHNDDSLDDFDRHDKVVEVLLTLPEETLKKIEDLPLPPQASELPEDIQARMMAVKEDASLSFAEKCAKFKEIKQAIPQELRTKLRKGQ